MNDRAPKPPLPARRWVRVLLITAIAGNLIGAGGAMYMLSGSTDLSVDEAVQRYRANALSPDALPSATSAPSKAPTASKSKKGGPAKTAQTTTKTKTEAQAGLSEPELGVYVYKTDGYEETDALSGQRHDYPAESTLTISRHDCGVRFRWQPLKERWDESDGCLKPEGVVLSRFAIYHEFFHRGVLEDFALGDDALVLPEEPVTGDTWRWKGKSNDSAIDTLTTVIEFETIAVGSEQVRTVHVRYKTAMTGANEGTQTQDRWMDTRTGLLIRMITAVDAKVETPFGKANYTERYRIDLTSTKPEQ